MKNLVATALVAGLAAGALNAPSVAEAEEINVVLFGMPYTRGLQALAGDFDDQAHQRKGEGRDQQYQRALGVIGQPIESLQRVVQAGSDMDSSRYSSATRARSVGGISIYAIMRL